MQDRTQVAELAAALHDATRETGELASVDQGYTGEEPAAVAQAHGVELAVVKLPEATSTPQSEILTRCGAYQTSALSTVSHSLLRSAYPASLLAG